MSSLSPQEIWDFVDSKPGWAALTTLDSDGLPHTVAIGYFRLGQNLYAGCRAGTHKCKNLQANPKVSLMLERGKQRGELTGVLFQGLGRVIEDPQELLSLKKRLSRQRGEAEPDQVAEGIAYIEIVPQRIRSWKR